MMTRLLAALMLVALWCVPAEAATTVRFGATVEISDVLQDSLMSIAGKIDIPGRVVGDAMLASGHVTIEGTVENDVTAVTGLFTLPPQSQIGGDLRLASGEALIAGAVGGDVIVTAGTVTISGQIGGDVHTIAGRVIVQPGAVIGGRIITSGPGKTDIAPDAQILGGEASPALQSPPRPHEFRVFPTLILSTLGIALFELPAVGLGTLIVGLLFLAVFPHFAEATAMRLRSRPGQSVLTGFFTLMAAPLTMIVLAVTVLGLPVAVLSAAAFALILVVSYGIGAVALISSVWQRVHVGSATFTSLPQRFIWRALYLLIGLIVLNFLSHLPVAGSFVMWLTMMLGLGALTSEVLRRWRGVAAI
jgi:cytoskeletal protein CcmA (bactofilin family)